jgi:hypothetical protein
LRIRDVYLGSRIRIFSIPDPNFFHSGYRIRIKEFKNFLTQKNGFQALGNMIRVVQWCIPDLDFLPKLDTGVKEAPDPGGGSATLQFRALSKG